MTKRLVIHIGAHKTGSTLIQETLDMHSRDLVFQDIWFDRKFSYNLSLELMGKSPLGQVLLYDVANKLEKHHSVAQQSTIFWSSEGFFGDFTHNYANLVAVAKDLQELVQNYEVTLVAFVRRQDTFVESAFQQMVKQGQVSKFLEFQEKVDIQSFDWFRLISHYKQIFPKATLYVFPYEMILREQNAAIKTVLSILGASLDIPVTKASNPSLSDTGVKLAKWLRYVPSDKIRHVLKKSLQRAFPKPPHQPFNILEPARREALLHYYAEGNAALFDTYIQDDTFRAYYLGESDNVYGSSAV